MFGNLTKDLDHDGVALGATAVLQSQDVFASVISVDILSQEQGVPV